ncbi:amidase family protein [Limimaricola pyoseonensis]|uniref:Aspartyl-tRNA(Asn)/glutamyl-tRNA(Gln) amidotransferase subunit A n=1 Tax=Limimaricola pyoseonensis TaxID=521013 RepID=A0A1G7FWM4_9RHOB|nr:amidase family protein [Limimaricola pyoseonensis]SDE80281.1 aspartyl-tRNA(Asn)/glutamyl-tRNA(Gln) amidotransferase subunit A [Limimaricola pyoseonensis]
MTAAGWRPETAPDRLAALLDRLGPEGGPRGIYTSVFAEAARADADAARGKAGPLAGALVSVKGLLDVAGEITHAGTRFLETGAPARADAPAVARLRAAGAVLTGHTAMSELAYSGLGLNDHHGTADNPAWPGRIPGGSTSGGAASVAAGLADIAIGSDTGGSLRIPAAFCGLTGFKPTQSSVPREGAVPLSDSLDSLGPIARDVAGCAAAWRVMAGRAAPETAAAPLRLRVARNFGFDDLDPEVAQGFEALLGRLRDAGHEIDETPLPLLDDAAAIPPWHLTAVECRAHHEDAFREQAPAFDPRVHARMARADEVSAVAYRRTLNARARFADAFAGALEGQALLLPSVAILPPRPEDLEDDAAFNRLNLLALRNTTLGNIADGCGIALPYREGGTLLSAMLIAGRGADEALLSTAAGLEPALAAA